MRILIAIVLTSFITVSCAEESSSARKATTSTKKPSKSSGDGSKEVGSGDPEDEENTDTEEGSEDPAESETPAPKGIDITTDKLEILPPTLAELNIYSNKGVLNSKIPFLNYEVNSALWSDGADKKRSLLLPKGATLTAAQFTGNIVFPAGTILVKHFTSPVDKSPVETRVMLKRPNSTWDFAAYKWAADGTTKRVSVPDVQEAGANKAWPKGYRIPAESECVKCHNPNVLDVLGFRPDQLKGVLEKLAEEKVVSAMDLETFKKAVPQQDPKLTTLSAEARAKAYLQVNCAQCHQPNGAKSSLPLGLKNMDWASMLKAPPTMTGDVLADSPVITPGAPEKSKLYLRFTATKNRMPAVSVYQDPLGEEVIKAWIMSIPDTCTAANTATCTAPVAK